MENISPVAQLRAAREKRKKKNILIARICLVISIFSVFQIGYKTLSGKNEDVSSQTESQQVKGVGFIPPDASGVQEVKVNGEDFLSFTVNGKRIFVNPNTGARVNFSIDQIIEGSR